MTRKKTLRTILLTAMLSSFGCSPERPAPVVNIGDLPKYTGNSVIVHALPEWTGEGSFTLSEGEHKVNVEGTYSANGKDSYAPLRAALEKEIDDGDNERVTAYGLYNDGYLRASYVGVEEIMYPIHSLKK